MAWNLVAASLNWFSSIHKTLLFHGNFFVFKWCETYLAYWNANSVCLLKHRSICIYQLLCACFDMSYILTVAIDACLLRFHLGKKYSIDSSCLTKLVHILSLLEKNLPTLMPVAVGSSKTCLNVISPPTPFYPKAPRHIRRHQTFETH